MSASLALDHILRYRRPPVVVVGGVATTLNPLDKQDVTLDPGNLTATATVSATGGVRTIGAVAALQKVYFEIVAVNINDTGGFGFSTAADPVGAIPGFDVGNNGFCFLSSGQFHNQNSLDHQTNLGVASSTDGDNIGIAYDGPNGKLFMRLNGVAWNPLQGGTQNPATNTGGARVILNSANPLFGHLHVHWNTGVSTAKFASADWAYAAPSDFTPLVM